MANENTGSVLDEIENIEIAGYLEWIEPDWTKHGSRAWRAFGAPPSK